MGVRQTVAVAGKAGFYPRVRVAKSRASRERMGAWLFWVVLVGVLWGATNPLLRLASKGTRI